MQLQWQRCKDVHGYKLKKSKGTKHKKCKEKYVKMLHKIFRNEDIKESRDTQP